MEEVNKGILHYYWFSICDNTTISLTNSCGKSMNTELNIIHNRCFITYIHPFTASNFTSVHLISVCNGFNRHTK